jgi:hypothetical protein
MSLQQIETISPAEVCKALNLSHLRLINAILNGTLPIGAVAEPKEEGEHYVVRIYKERYEKYTRGEL